MLLPGSRPRKRSVWMDKIAGSDSHENNESHGGRVLQMEKRNCQRSVLLAVEKWIPSRKMDLQSCKTKR